MNERFWELVEQADEEGGDDPDIRDEVFAKLIIQECANWIDVSSPIKLGAALQKHFGVEE